MAAQSVTLKLTLPYPMRAEELESIKPKTYEQVTRELSEMFIVRAVTNAHGAELDQKAGRLYASIKRELDRINSEILLNGTQWEWLAACFFGPKAEEIKIPPSHTVWWFQWLDALEEIRAAQRAAGGA
jgi:hypothetical protein